MIAGLSTYSADFYVVIREIDRSMGPFFTKNSVFWFGTLGANLNIDHGYVTKFTSLELVRLKKLKSLIHAQITLQTIETFVTLNEAINFLSGNLTLKPKALKRLKRKLGITGIWADLGTSIIE